MKTKQFMFGVLVGSALIGAAWFTAWVWPRITTSETEKIMNVVRTTIEGRLRGALLLDIAKWRDVPPSGSSPMRPRMIEVTAVYERGGKVKRITFPIFVEDGMYTTPRADVLERLDMEADIVVVKTGQHQ